MYIDLLENIVDPILTENIEKDDYYLEVHVIFQQGGAAPHFTLAARQL